MREADPHDEMEKALLRLMPAALSVGSQNEIDDMIDELADGAKVKRHGFGRPAAWLGVMGAAAALALGVFLIPFGSDKASPLAASPLPQAGLVVLAETDRVENVRDAGLFVDAGGSAVRKMRVRVVEESRIRDEETGIELTLTVPREETYLMPVSTF